PPRTPPATSTLPLHDALPIYTSAGGLARLPALLSEHEPDIVIIELGGNDGLRGQPPAQLKRNLAAMAEQAQQAGAKVLLLGMRMPPNLGQRYTSAFADAFDSLAAEKDLPYVPFLLEGIDRKSTRL